ncbi:pullulanase-type alpha-1,6-glucosidase [Streptomyces sp. RFCAC02]|uniref:pullulanase-type alpha-1,6-glucosidase n=1 Tax=Streptomyces sp. RFCAC02 TaxID=2499143 RepID=UPI0010224009|nr:pullulanase-type alpha-1,6-glucosidase [Streptomyces sp. RFCAC02]
MRHRNSGRRTGAALGALALLACLFTPEGTGPAHADGAGAGTPPAVALTGTVTEALGCPAAGADCPAARLSPAPDGTWSGTFALPEGEWTYGTTADTGRAAPLSVPAGGARVTVVHDPATHRTADDLGTAIVTAAGTFQAALGCPADWSPDCLRAWLDDPDGDGVHTFTTFAVPAGDHQVKAVTDRAWTGAYGAGGVRGGESVHFTVPPGGARTTFRFDAATHRIDATVTATHTVTADEPPLVTAVGTFQSAAGCEADWQPACDLTRLTDEDGDGTFTWSTTGIPAGAHEAKVAIGGTWDENYGAGGERNGPNIAFRVPDGGGTVTFTYTADDHVLAIDTGAPPGDGTAPGDTFRAHWLTRDRIAWEEAVAGRTFWLYAARDGGVTIGQDSHGVPLTHEPSGLPADTREAYPHLASLGSLRLPGDLGDDDLRALLSGDLAIAAFGADGRLAASTRLQTPGVLDDLYAAARSRALGPAFDGDGTPTLTLWAPTARSVTVRLYDTPGAGTPTATADLTPGADGDGVWSVRGEPGWKDDAYVFDVEVFVPETGRVEHNEVTDPYSLGLTADGARSVLLDLADPALAPDGWDDIPAPSAAAPEELTIHELHVRDFSVADTTVPAERRGTYAAFTDPDTDGMRRLAALAEHGPTAVHLLPTADFSPVPERRADRAEPDCDLPSEAPDSDRQQACVAEVRDRDGFDWGYNTQHFTTPEGSYATDPDGGRRTLEFRAMVAGLRDAGLRTVMDVVYNHTPDHGQDGTGNLDRIVPGYYHRLDADGAVTTSTCCSNTATEHAMMAKLMTDSVVTWATAYRVDGFRFDLMGHHPKSVITGVRAALDALTPERDGVDGSAVVLYGEGWDFGEVAGDARFVQATQENMAGTGVGTFNDRLRDAVRGGGPFDADPRVQGFASGLFTDPNGAAVNGSEAEQRDRLLLLQDQIRVGLTGNLADYTFTDRTGRTVRGAEVPYGGGAPTGYTADPQEAITYVEAHDNLTLYDSLAYKLPTDTPMSDRVRHQILALATTALGQGTTFWHAGTELLRSKSFDGNSYNSGDWFNLYDPSGTDNGFGRGLPPEDDNGALWDHARPRLADPALRPAPADLAAADALARDLVALRAGNPLLHLGTADLIREKVTFPGAGTGQTPGVIVMRIDDTAGGTDADPAADGLVVVLNATTGTTRQTVPGAAGAAYALDPVQAGGADPVVREAAYDSGTGTFTVPPLTAAVFRTTG